MTVGLELGAVEEVVDDSAVGDAFDTELSGIGQEDTEGVSRRIAKNTFHKRFYRR